MEESSKTIADKFVRTAQSVILVYSTITAIHGLCLYINNFSKWAECKFSKTEDGPYINLVPDESE